MEIQFCWAPGYLKNLSGCLLEKGSTGLFKYEPMHNGIFYRVLLKVYDSEDRLVFDEAIDGDIVVEKSFNFEKAFKDEYTIVVVDKFGTYKKTMEVR